MKKTSRTQGVTAEIKELAEKLLGYLGLTGKVDVQEKDEETVLVDIDTPDAPILIGRHGETLSAFQTILAQTLYNPDKENKKIIVDCGGWRGKQEDILRNMATSAAQRVVETGKPQPIFNLRPDERRIIHMVLTDHPDVLTESEGEGRDRHILIIPKKKNKD